METIDKAIMTHTVPHFTIEKTQQNNFLIAGELSLATVSEALSESSRLFDDGSEITVDLINVSHVDSAGIALLIEWLGMAKHQIKKLEYRNIPKQMLAIARISGLEGVLTDTNVS